MIVRKLLKTVGMRLKYLFAYDTSHSMERIINDKTCGFDTTTTLLFILLLLELLASANGLPDPDIRHMDDITDKLNTPPPRKRTVSKTAKKLLMKYAKLARRPTPSDELPILPLKYPDNKYSPPSEEDIDPTLLFDILGSNYDPAFSSVARPPESLLHPNGTYIYNPPAAHRFYSNLKLLSVLFPGKLGTRTIEIRNRKRRLHFQRYLSAYTQCPTHSRWKDLGVFYWPRWIREGDCRDHGELKPRTCSIPSGMVCRAQKSMTKTLLWWHCQKKGSCKWISIKYPIITACGCMCERSGS